jgi:hypothetical protein
MEALRVRVGAILEWALAAAFVAGVVATGSIVIREFRTVRAVVPVIAGETRLFYDTPAAIPPRSVSVPMLLLGNGRELRVGDGAAEAIARLGSAVTLLSESVERSAFRERLTRFYSEVGVQFAVVFETLEQQVEPRVAAIYLR